jgi:hypothetical protein
MEKRPAEAENGDADGSAAKKAKKDPECGVLLFCGSTNWEAVSIFGFFIFSVAVSISVFPFSEALSVFSIFSIFGSVVSIFGFPIFEGGQDFRFFHYRKLSVFSVFPLSEAISIFGFSIFGSGQYRRFFSEMVSGFSINLP